MKTKFDDVEEAVNLESSLCKSLSNKLHAVYNLGYKAGYSDAAGLTIDNFRDKVLEILENELDESEEQE